MKRNRYLSKQQISLACLATGSPLPIGFYSRLHFFASIDFIPNFPQQQNNWTKKDPKEISSYKELPNDTYAFTEKVKWNFEVLAVLDFW